MKLAARVSTTVLAALLSVAACPGAFAETAPAPAPHESISPAFAYPIANVPGKTMTAIVVDYPPGGKSLPHRHGSAFVVGYVLSGAIRSQVNTGEEHVYHTGESWTETPGAHHKVSENASATEPARLLAIFVADKSDKNLVVWDKQHPGDAAAHGNPQ
jgi:quercetin dioxygenase-like cupin family protein